MPLSLDTPAGRAAVLDVLRETRPFLWLARDQIRRLGSTRLDADDADRLLAAIDALLREEE